jgi:hypothetical protein
MVRPQVGHALLRRLVAGFLPRRPGFEPGPSHVGSAVERAELGQDFRVRFPGHSFIPQIAPQSSLCIIQGWYNRPINGRYNCGLCSIPAPQINKKSQMSTRSIKIMFLGSKAAAGA